MDENADGFRLPTYEEWVYAAKGGENYKSSGSNNLDAVGWYYKNSEDHIQKVAQKKANGYGIYDMSGNVMEWVWNSASNDYSFRFCYGGNYYWGEDYCKVDYRYGDYAGSQYNYMGFRILRPNK